MKYEETVIVERTTVERLTKICAKPPGRDEVDPDSTVFDHEVKFPGGIVIAVQVCADSDPDKHSCWCQAVLFETGDSGDLYEISCSEVEDRPWGDWGFDHDGNEYLVTMEPET